MTRDEDSRRDEKRHYIVAGRIKFYRLMGKASFIKIEDESGILQIYIARDNLPEGFYNNIFKKLIEVGDIIDDMIEFCNVFNQSDLVEVLNR